MKSGIGIRPELFESVLQKKPPLGFLEAHSENYFGDSLSRQKLLELRTIYPISLHGVGLSLGRADDLNQIHLKQLKQLVDDIDPLYVSEHLAWSAYAHQHVPDLLPLPLTEQSLEIMCQHVEQMQNVLQRQILVENPSNYLLFEQLQITEPEFLNNLAQRTGCQLLVDVNNIHVSASNLGHDAVAYIQQLNSTLIGQYHLAGYTEVERDNEKVLIDTHNQPVYQPVWALFEQVISQHGARSTLIEWDSDFPELAVLLAECDKANHILEQTNSPERESSPEQINNTEQIKAQPTKLSLAESSVLAKNQQDFLQTILVPQKSTGIIHDNYQHRFWIYQNNVFSAVRDYLADVYPALKGVLGDAFFMQTINQFIKQQPPSEGNIHVYGEQLAQFVCDQPSLHDMPYLQGLMAYEWALHHAYFTNLVDHPSQVLNPQQFTQEGLLAVGVKFNLSVTIIESSFPIYQIHSQSLPSYDGKVAIDLSQSQDVLLVYKSQYRVNSKLLTQQERIVLQQIREQPNLLQAIEQLGGSLPVEALSKILTFVFDAQLLMLELDSVDTNHGKMVDQYQATY